MREFERWKYPIIGAVAGLLLAVLLLTLGFLKTLLILLLVVAGTKVGYRGIPDEKVNATSEE